MAQTLEQRMDRLEKQVAELAAQCTAPRDKTAWQRTFGLSRDDPAFQEMVDFGREYREKLKDQGNNAGS